VRVYVRRISGISLIGGAITDETEIHECEGENCSLCPSCYRQTGNDVCAYTCTHDNGYDAGPCLDARDDDPCKGKVMWRYPGYGEARFLRCEKHGMARIDRAAKQRQDWPDSPIPPRWFDPLAAGEAWDEPE
jgi:hypothetical protein